jgi:hypothetical protein
MPVDPDLDDLPAELRQREGPFTVSAVDPDTGELCATQADKNQQTRATERAASAALPSPYRNSWLSSTSP